MVEPLLGITNKHADGTIHETPGADCKRKVQFLGTGNHTTLGPKQSPQRTRNKGIRIRATDNL
jgi:hypothetical protein